MRFLWHHALWLLLAPPALVGACLLSRRRGDRGRLRYPGLTPAGGADRWQHLSSLLLFAGVSALVLAVARPVFIATMPASEGTIVLLIDVSLSMAASDVPPTRLEAARVAAIEFVEAQPRDVRIGIVTFGGYADIVQTPTKNRRDVLAALEHLELQRFTAIGNGLIGALLALRPGADVPQGYDIFGMGRAVGAANELPREQNHFAAAKPRKRAAPGSYLSAAVILVSDGRGTMGVAPEKAAQMLADEGIRVYAIGVGTLYGGVANVEGWPSIHAEFAEETLKEIADITGGEYFLARDRHKVKRVYESLQRRVIFEQAEHEVTVLFAAAGMILSLAAAAWSLLPRDSRSN